MNPERQVDGCQLLACRAHGHNRAPAGTDAPKLLIEKNFRGGGEGEIRTHVPELPDHPISSRRRYDHFGTSPAVPLAGAGILPEPDQTSEAT